MGPRSNDGIAASAVIVAVLRLHEADGIHAGTHHHVHAVMHNLARSDTHSHEARRAQTVNGHTRGGNGQARRRYAEAPDVVALRALLRSNTEHEIFHGRRVDSGAKHRLAHRMASQYRRFGVVEGTAKGFADGGTGDGDDDCFTHDKNSYVEVELLGRSR